MSPEVPSTADPRALLEFCPLGVMAVDGDGRVLWINRALARLLGEAADDLVGLQRGTHQHPRLAGLLSESPRFDLSDAINGVRHLERSRVPVTGAAAVAELHYIADVTDRLRLEAECSALRQEAQSLRLREPDTGLLNRRALMLALEPQVSRSRRYNNPLAVVMLHVDFVPDAKETATRRVAQLLKDQLRWADLVARDDDGSFVLVLPETDRDATLRLCEKLAGALTPRAEIAACLFGSTAWTRTDNAEALLARAGSALAQARTDGPAHVSQ